MTARTQTTCEETGCRSRRLGASPLMRQEAGSRRLWDLISTPLCEVAPLLRRRGYGTLRCYATWRGIASAHILDRLTDSRTGMTDSAPLTRWEPPK